ncbi:hypothetical protein [Streptomyces sp. NRRL F-525]|uniref:hypothetical protein n=1 Tax=Streptomyces sp. NRRL F-525 TaxID=1463861 RepID=UPI000998B7F2
MVGYALLDDQAAGVDDDVALAGVDILRGVVAEAGFADRLSAPLPPASVSSPGGAFDRAHSLPVGEVLAAAEGLRVVGSQYSLVVLNELGE